MKTRSYLSIAASAATAILLVATAAGLSVSPLTFANAVEEIANRLSVDRFVDAGATRISSETASAAAPAVSNSNAFHFRPPLGAGGGDHRRFDPSLLDFLLVEICEVSGGNCVPVRTFTSQSGTPEAIRITGQQYHVNFNAAAANLSNLATYRVRVIAANLPLGSIDVTPAMRGGLGGTWPIKFLIEQDPAIRVRVLRFRGQSAPQIVSDLKSEFNLCGQEAASLLASDLRPFPQAEIDVAISGVCQDVVIPNTTKVADETTRNALLSYDQSTGRMVFAEFTDLLRRLRTGDVFVGEPSDAAPFGYLRKVTNISRVSGQVILETVQAKLNEAIYRGTLHATGELVPNDGTQPSRSPATASRGKDESPNTSNIIIDEGDVFNFHRDIDVTINFDGSEEGVEGTGTVRVTGFVYFNAGYNVGIGIRPCLEIPPACPDRFEAWAGLEQKSRLRVTGTFDGTLNKERIIHPIPMKPILFFIGPIPVVLVPEINVKLGINGEAHVDFVFEGEAKSKFKAGAKWLNPEYGGNGWNNISEYVPLDKEIHAANINARMRVESYAKADAKIKLYGVVGPGIDGSVGILVDANTNRKPFWFMQGHVTTNVKFEASIADIIELAEYSTPILNEYIHIAESPNSPPVFSNVRSDTIFADINVPLTLGPRSGFSGYFDVRDPEGDVPILTAHSNVDGNIPLTYAFRTVGPRTITITARDSEGATATATLRVEVRNSLPIIFLPPLTNTFPATLQYFVNVTAFDPETGFLGCSSIRWEVSGLDTSSAVTGCASTIVFNQQGNRTITIRATDPHGGVGTATISVNVTAPPANRPPVLDTASFSVAAARGPASAGCLFLVPCEVPEEGITVLNNGSAGSGFWHPPLTMSVGATDPEGGPVTYHWSCMTGNQPAIVTDLGGGIFSCNPIYSPNALIVVSVIARDSAGNATSSSPTRTFSMLQRVN